MIVSCFALFLAFWNYNMLDDYMITKLFKLTSPPSTVSNQNLKKAQPMKAPLLYNQREFFRSLLPQCLWCCKLSRQERAFDKAREALDFEVNIIELVKSRRMFKEAFKMLLSETQLKRLQKKSGYRVLDPDKV